MSNFTRSGRRAKIWQSIANLSCCSIDLMTKQTKSMKALALIMLFVFSTSSMFAQQDLERRSFIDGCQDEAPAGFTEDEVALLYANQCGDNSITVVKSTVLTGDDCNWDVEHTYEIKCGSFEDEFKIGAFGGDRTPPELDDDAEVPPGGQNMNLCLSDAPAGPSEADIADLYSDNCGGDVIVTKSGGIEGTDCSWNADYKYAIYDACGNGPVWLDIHYSGGDNEAPQLTKGAVIPTGEPNVNACFNDKPQGPTIEDITALFTDNCGVVTVTKTGTSKGSDCKWLAQYTYTIKDDCDNFAENIVVTYSGSDSEDPVLQGVPGDMVVDCIDDIPEPDKNVTATDNCALKLQVTFSDDNSQLGDACTGGIVIRTYSVSDECGGTDSQTQTITVLPTPEATLAQVLFVTNISCEEAASFEAPSIPYTNGVEGGACAVSGSLEPNVTFQYNECGGTITITYDGLDSCDRPLSAGPISITVDPAPEASFDGLQDMTISCEEAGSFQPDALGYSNGATGACEISGSVPGIVSGGYTECGGQFTVDYSFTDNCGRTITAKKEVFVSPAPEAEFADPGEMTITCEEANNFVAGSLSYSNGASTEACLISGSVTGEATPDYNECGGSIVVNWTYTDDCERTITASKTIEVLPAPEAAFDAIDDMTITCDEAASFQPADLGYSNGGTGTCEISGFAEGQLVGSYTECGGQFTIDYAFTDICGRTITTKKEVFILPAPEAEFADPGEMTISCEEANNFVAGSLSYTNGASTDACLIAGSAQGEATSDYTECGGTITVNWTFTDDCQRTINATKTITVEPAPEAEFNLVENMTISCAEAASFEPEALGYSNGGTGICEISGSVEGDLSGDYTECGGQLTVDYSYTDDCGRTITAKKEVFVEPAPAAVFNPVQNISIACYLASQYEVNPLGYSNGEAGACEISGQVPGVLSGSYTECGGTLFVDWNFVDDCGREITARKVITVQPAPPAQFEETEDMIISCEEANAFQAGSLSYTNGSSSIDCLISGSVEGEATPDYDECGGSFEVNWTFTDECNRTITASKTITVLPAPPAEFDPVQDMTVTCDEAAAIVAYPLGYTNGGTGACEISGQAEGVLSGTYDECGGILYIDWNFTDDCQREITAKKAITVLPAPVAEFADPGQMTITCEEANDFTAGSLSYTNGATTEACLIAGSAQGEATPNYNECGGEIVVEWTYTDDCQRTITATKTITVLPAPAATFEPVDNITISCEEAGSLVVPSLAYNNGGTGDCEISGSVQGVLSGEYTECGGLLFIDWTFTDECNRTITERQQIKVNPAPEAEFADPGEMTITCEEANVFQAPSLFYTNGAENALCLIEGFAAGEATPNYNECGGEIVVNWTFTDDCDRTITASKTIIVLPAPPAEFDPVQDMTVTCDEAAAIVAYPLGYTNGGTGTCEISGEAPGVLTGSYTECGGTLYIDWNFTDDCGRPISAKKEITVSPAPVAEFADPGQMTITCEEANAFVAGTLSYTNGATTEACLIAGSAQGEATPDYDECGGEIVVNWTYTDDCDRTITASKTITVLPAPPAEFDPVQDMTVTCDEAAAIVAYPLGYSNGGTGTCEISGQAPGVLSGSYTECGGTLYIDWNFTDDCQRSISAKIEITVLPAPVAEFADPGQMTITCEEANVFQAGTLSYTNGATTEACLIAGSAQGEATPDYNECGGEIVVEWTYTDDCDRTITATKTITVLPAPPAVFDTVEDMTISCEEAGELVNGFNTTEGFVGDFAPENWIISPGFDGNVTITESAITIVGGNDGTGFADDSNATATCPISGVYSFDWNYSTEDAPGFDPAYFVNGVAYLLAESDGSGSLTLNCSAGDVIGFGVYSEDSNFGAATLEITNFSVGANNMPLSYTNGGTGACEISGSVPGVLSGNYTECGGILYIDWSFTDECDRTITAKKTITVEPAPEAVFEPVQNMTISCEEANVFEASSLGYTNEGTGVCEISGSVEGELSGIYTECGGNLEVNWTYTDNCNRTITATQLITVEEAPEAEFDEIADASIPCEDLATYEPEFLSYSNGGTGACEISGSVQGVAQPFDGSCGTFDVDFTFTDDCGRTITAKHTITVIDETPPVFIGEAYPQGESNVNACLDNLPEGPPVIDIINMFEDNCGNVNVIKTISYNPAENTDCLWAIIYAYEIQDDCGNFAEEIKIAYNGGDKSAPELVGTLPVGVTGLQCLSENPGAPEAADLEGLYTDNCGDVTVTALEPVIAGTDCGWTATYRYTVQDSCLNFADDIVIINSGADTTPPELVGELPPHIVNSNNLCYGDDINVGEPSAEDFALLYLDNCSAVTVNKVEVLYIGNDCEWIKVFEYTAKDACNNMAQTYKITYAGGDTEAPRPTGQCENETMYLYTDSGADCPQDATISLNVLDEILAGDNTWSVAGLTIAELGGSLLPCFYDNCADTSELTFRVIGKGEDRTDCLTTLTITFEVEDNCENVSEPFVCTFVIEDDTAPVIECPIGVDFGLVTETPTAFEDKAPYTDNCQGSGQTQDFSDNLTSEIDEVADSFTIICLDESDGLSEYSTWNWILREIDGNGYPIYDVLEFPEPQFIGFTAVLSYNLGLGRYEVDLYLNGTLDDDNAWYAETDSGTVPCSADAWVVVNEFCTLDFICDNNAASSTETFTLIRTFTANDGCGNTATCDVTYTWSIEENNDIACGDVVSGNTEDADANNVPFCGTNLETAPGEFYTFIGTGDIVTVSTCSANTTYDTKLGVFTDDGATCVGGDDDLFTCTHSSFHSEVTFTSVVGQEYQIYVTGFGSNAGDYELSVECIELADNNDCADATKIACGDSVTGTTLTASGDDTIPSCGTSLTSAPGVWYVLDGTGDVLNVTADTFGSTFDTKLAVFEGSCGDLICVDGNDDTGGIQSEVSFQSEVDVDYYIYVTGFGSNSGDYTLTVACDAPINFREANVEIDFTAYPVPFDKEVNIAYSFEFDTDVTIEIFDTKGLLILSEENNSYVAGSKDKSTFDLSRHSSQLFYVKLITSQGSVTKKIVSSGK